MIDRRKTQEFFLNPDRRVTRIKLWVIGYNMPGYLPESEPGSFYDWPDARDALLDDINNAFDQDFEAVESASPPGRFHDAAEQLNDEYLGALQLVRELSANSEFGITISTPWGSDIHYWLSLIETDEPATSPVGGE